MAKTLTDAARSLERLAVDGVPRAVARALNSAAAKVVESEVNHMRGVFDRPTPYTLNALRIKRAKPASDLVATVAVKDATAKGIAANKFLGPQIQGGQRSQKRMEKALVNRGLMYRDEVAVPGSGANLDGYGNVQRSQIVQMLSFLDAFGEQGYRANSTPKSRARSIKGTRSRRGQAFFVSRGRGQWFGGRSWLNGRRQHLARGIYQRVYFGFGSALKPVFLFVQRANYRKRFDFYGVAARSAGRWLPRYMREEFSSAVSRALKG